MIRDIDIRQALKRMMNELHAAEPDTVVVDELGLRQGTVRVDVAVVNGTLSGYEIKSDADTLRRLSSQVKTYSEVLDYAGIVTSAEHDVAAAVPEWWGIVSASERNGAIELDVERIGRRNPSVDARALVELLWHDEAIAMLQARGAGRGVLGKPRRAAWDRVCAVCSLDEIRDEVRRRLKERAERRAAPLSS